MDEPASQPRKMQNNAEDAEQFHSASSADSALIVCQKDKFAPTWARVDDPRPCATTTVNRRKAAVNQTPPPYPCFHVWSASADPLSYAVAASTNALTPTLPIESGEVSGTITSADVATSVSPAAVPAANPRRFASPPSSGFKYGGSGASESVLKPRTARMF